MADLFGLFVWSVFATALTKLFELKSFLERLLVFAAVIIDVLALRTLEFDEIVLGHRNDITAKPYLDHAFLSRRGGKLR